MSRKSTKLVGSSNQYFSRSDASQTGLDFDSGDMSGFASLKPTSVSALIVAKSLFTGSQLGYQWYLDASTGKVVFFASSDGSSSTRNIYTSTIAVDINDYNDIGFFFDTSTEVLKFVINGVEDTPTQSGTGFSGTIFNNTQPFAVGSESTTTTSSTTGKIARVRLWNDLMNTTQLNKERGSASAVHTTGLKLDVGFDGTSTDASPEGNDLTNNNSATYVNDSPMDDLALYPGAVEGAGYVAMTAKASQVDDNLDNFVYDLDLAQIPATDPIWAGMAVDGTDLRTFTRQPYKSALLVRGSGKYFEIDDADQTNLEFTGGVMSFKIKVKLTQLPSTAGDSFAILSRDGVTTGTRAFLFEANADDTLRVLYWDSSNNLTRVRTTGTLGAEHVGAWVELAIRVTASTQTVDFLIDDVEQATTGMNALASAIRDTTASFIIGSRDNTTKDDFADMAVANARIWSASLSNAEFTAEKASATPVKTASLEGAWEFNGDSRDSSGNENHLTAVATPAYSVDNPIDDFTYALPIHVLRAERYTTQLGNQSDTPYQSNVFGSQWLSQSFTTVGAFTVASVKLRVYKIGTPTADWTVGIYASSGDSPTGSALATGTIDPTTFTTDSEGGIVEIVFDTPTALSATTKYVIRISMAGDDISNNGVVKKSANAYSGGKAQYSSNSGSSWLADGPSSNADWYFRVCSDERSGRVFFRGDTDSSTDKDFHLYYNGTSEARDADARYGQHEVWSDLEHSFLMEDEADSAGNTDLTNTGTTPFNDGIFGKSAEFDGASSRRLGIASDNLGLANAGNYFWDIWIEIDVMNAGYWLDHGTTDSSQRVILYPTTDRFKLFVSGNEIDTGAGSVSAGDIINITVIKTGTSFELFLGGVSKGTVSWGSLTYNTNAFAVGCPFDGFTSKADGKIDSVRLSSTLNPSSLYVSTKYNNQNNQATFWTWNDPVPKTYATLNPSDKDADITLSGDKLTATIASGVPAWKGVRSTIGKTEGKWYWEYTVNVLGSSGTLNGIAKSTATLAGYPGVDANGYGYQSADGRKHVATVASAYGATYTTNDVIGVALDMDGGTVTMYKNGVSQGTLASGLTGELFAMVAMVRNEATAIEVNFGATAFAYTVPSGYNSGLYTSGGTASTKAITASLTGSIAHTQGRTLSRVITGAITGAGSNALTCTKAIAIITALAVATTVERTSQTLSRFITTTTRGIVSMTELTPNTVMKTIRAYTRGTGSVAPQSSRLKAITANITGATTVTLVRVYKKAITVAGDVATTVTSSGKIISRLITAWATGAVSMTQGRTLSRFITAGVAGIRNAMLPMTSFIDKYSSKTVTTTDKYASNTPGDTSDNN